MGRGKTVSFARIIVSHLPGAAERGIIRAGALAMACRLGRRGILRHKREGDHATPAGTYRLLHVYYRRDRLARPRSLLPLSPLHSHLGWCDDPANACYNRPVTLPFAGSHETLWRQDPLYDIVVTIDYNMRPRVRGRGSAIFLHRAGDGPTAGCIALPPDALRRLLPRLSTATLMVIR